VALLTISRSNGVSNSINFYIILLKKMSLIIVQETLSSQ